MARLRGRRAPRPALAGPRDADVGHAGPRGRVVPRPAAPDLDASGASGSAAAAAAMESSGGGRRGGRGGGGGGGELGERDGEEGEGLGFGLRGVFWKTALRGLL